MVTRKRDRRRHTNFGSGSGLKGKIEFRIWILFFFYQAGFNPSHASELSKSKLRENISYNSLWIAFPYSPENPSLEFTSKVFFIQQCMLRVNCSVLWKRFLSNVHRPQLNILKIPAYNDDFYTYSRFQEDTFWAPVQI